MPVRQRQAAAMTDQPPQPGRRSDATEDCRPALGASVARYNSGQFYAEAPKVTVTIYHNPRCSKSRQTLQLLESRGIAPAVVEYLRDPPDAETLQQLVRLLGRPVADIMRSGEDEYAAAAGQISAMTDKQKLEWLAAHPRVLQRPIVVSNGQARIGRPPEAVLEIIGD